MPQTWLPAPIKGMNLRDPFYALQPGETEWLVNLIPTEKSVRLRPGLRRHAYPAPVTGPLIFVDGLHALRTTSGTDKIIACADNKIFDVTAEAAGTDITGALTITNNFWQGFQFNNRLILMNGEDPVVVVDGTPTASAAGFVGPGGDDDDLIAGFAFKERPFLIEKDSLSYWYGEEGAITGPLHEVDLSSVFDNGGYLLFGAAFFSSGAQGEPLAVFVTSSGEVAMFAGLYPDSTDWYLVARLQIPMPLGRRAFHIYQTDILILTSLGVVPLSKAAQAPDARVESFGITDLVWPLIQTHAEGWPTEAGWCITEDKAQGFLIINLPQFRVAYTYSPGFMASHRQLVMNLRTGAWSKFEGIPARSFVYANGEIYFGTYYGTIGRLPLRIGDVYSDYVEQDLRTGTLENYATAWQFATPLSNFGDSNQKLITGVTSYASYYDDNYHADIVARNRFKQFDPQFDPTQGLSGYQALLQGHFSDSDELPYRHDIGTDGEWLGLVFYSNPGAGYSIEQGCFLEWYGVEIAHQIGAEGP